MERHSKLFESNDRQATIELVVQQFRDFASSPAQHQVRMLDCAQPVRDSDRGPLLRSFIQRFLYHCFGPGIQCSSCLVQEQDFGITEESACNGQALFLTPAEHDALGP